MASRTDKVIKNVKYAIIGQIFTMILSFITRKIFVSLLSTEYLGLSGVFSNILTLLSLTEFGFGTALIFSLYKPLEQKDKEKIKTLVALYRKIYTIIGLAVCILGFLFTPFLNFIVKEMPILPNIRLIYILYVLNSGFSYFLVHKRSLIIADQNRYISTIYNIICKSLMYILQITLLLLTHNFIVYLLVMIASVIGENLLNSHKANELYPYLKEPATYILTLEEKITLKKNIIGVSFHKTGDVFVNGVSNILIGKLIGVLEVGLYSNYLLIRNAITIITNLIYQSLTPSIGNLNITADDKNKIEVFNKLNFMNTWIFGFCSTCLVCLYNPFITIWIGEKYLFTMDIVLVFVLNFYLLGMRMPVSATKDAMGIYWVDRYKGIFEAMINLGVSIVLGKYLGIAGIFLGNLISNICTTFWVYPYVLYKHGFHEKSYKYFLRFALYTFIVFTTILVTYCICNLFNDFILLSFVFKFMVCMIVPNVIFIVISLLTKSQEFIYFVNLIKHKMFRYRILRFK